MRRILFLAVFLVVVLSSSGFCDEPEYFALFMDGQKIGYAVDTRVVEGDKVTTTQAMHITITRMGMPITMKATETAIETVDGKPLGFELTQDMSLMTMKVTGRINDQGMMEVVTQAMGAEQKEMLPWPEGAVMSEGLRLLSRRMGLKAGTKYTAKVFTGGLKQAIDTEIEVGPRRQVDLLGRVVTLTEVKSTYTTLGTGQMTSIGYVDDELNQKKSEIPLMGMKIEMIACSETVALSPVEDTTDVIAKMLIQSPRPLNNLSQVKAITYRLIPAPGVEELTIPSTDNQKVRKNADNTYTLMVEPIRLPRGGRFPYAGNNTVLKQALESNAFLQCDDQRIVDLAKKVVGQTRDAAEAVTKIEAFVADYIDNKDLSVGYASAVEILDSREGDCTEHAVLCAALCRAVGIPAQVVVGVAYVDEFMGATQCFGGHAWTRAYVKGRWIGLDAAFKGTGRGGYDAGHIALAVGNGEPGDFFSLIGSMGQFTIASAEAQ